ncbi:hypothetical protein BB561_005019 [Smittium simulii]|uniref:Peptidase S1 domain-containing protein n=1 Tax=Smittium simulii TaxID=133385 RepID=A0A2T9YCS0_9FUNG|nr:hypothetical protein BB561_005019 [Smittium simulii]
MILYYPFLFALLILSGCIGALNNTQNFSDENTPLVPNIIHGVPVKKSDYPFIAQIFYLYKNEYIFWCTGSLISPNYILTAGHCITDPTRAYLKIDGVRVVVGKTDLADAKNADKFDTIKSMGTFNYKKIRQNDLALLRLSRNIPANEATPVKFYIKKITKNLKVQVAGFGETVFGSATPSRTLLQTTVDISSSKNCTKFNPEWSTNDGPQICQESYNGNDSCQGDSGGPLTTKINGINYLVGATNNGRNKNIDAKVQCGDNTIAYYARMGFFVSRISKVIKVNAKYLLAYNIHRIDDARTIITENTLKLVIIAPREKRKGQTIERSCEINRHPNHILCPVLAYTVYKARIATELCPTPHANNDSIIVNRLFRHTKHYNKPLSVDSITRQVKNLSGLIKRPPNTPIPKTRAIGATLAATSGVPVENIVLHAFWSNYSMFDTYYRLVRSTLSLI